LACLGRQPLVAFNEAISGKGNHEERQAHPNAEAEAERQRGEVCMVTSAKDRNGREDWTCTGNKDKTKTNPTEKTGAGPPFPLSSKPGKGAFKAVRQIWNNKTQAEDEQHGNAEIVEKAVWQMCCAQEFRPNGGKETETHDESCHKRNGPAAPLSSERGLIGALDTPSNEDDGQDRKNARGDASNHSSKECDTKEAEHK